MSISSKTLVDSLTVPTFTVDINHRVMAWNKACESLTGISAEDIIGTKDAWRGFYHTARPCLADVVVDHSERQLDELYPIYGEAIFSQGLHAESWFSEINGKKRYLIFDAVPLFDEDGTLVGALENLEDVTHIKQAELQGKTHSKVMSLLVEGASLSTVLESLIQEIELDDPFAHCSVLLLDQSGQHLTTGAAPSLPEFFTKEVDGVEIGDGVGSCGTSAFTQKRVIVDNIQTHPFWEGYRELAAQAGLGSCWSEPIIGSGGKLLGTFAIYHEHPIAPSEGDLKFIEFSSQLAAVAIEQSHLRHEQRLSSRIFNSTREGIMVTDSKGVMIDVNQAFTDITGYSRDEAIGKNPSILNSGKQDAEFYEHLWHTLSTYGYWQGELWNRAKDGTLYAEQLSISTLKDESNAVVNYVGIFSDITTSKQQQEKLKLMAHYDQLTKLPNRTLFNDRFNQAAAHSKRNGTHLAVVFIDLDNFKPVNDNLGHEVGDLLLIEVAERIKAAIREEDTVSRQGGDEFVILLNDMKFIPQSEELTRRIHESLSQPFFIGNHTVNISASSGIALYPRDDIDLDILIRYADQAMYQAKRTGKNRTQIFDKKSG